MAGKTGRRKGSPKKPSGGLTARQKAQFFHLLAGKGKSDESE